MTLYQVHLRAARRVRDAEEAERGPRVPTFARRLPAGRQPFSLYLARARHQAPAPSEPAREDAKTTPPR